jgi:hypothetical protein
MPENQRWVAERCLSFSMAGSWAFADHLADAKRNSNSGDIIYIAEKSPMLPGYLRAGLDALTRMPPA